MAESVINWAGVGSDQLGITIERYPALNRPARKYEKVSVPGRNGDIYFTEDAWENYIQEYEIWKGSQNSDAPIDWQQIFAWLYPINSSVSLTDLIQLTVKGYHRLIDDYEPGTIRLASFTDAAEIENTYNRFGRAVLRFDCRPERFTADAFTAIAVSASGATITNAGSQIAKPCIKVYGSGAGVVTVNGYMCTISNITGYLHIDSDSQNCFRGISDQNQNSLVKLTSGFPKLRVGSNVVTFSGGVTGVEIYPRSWNL